MHVIENYRCATICHLSFQQPRNVLNWCNYALVFNTEGIIDQFMQTSTESTMVFCYQNYSDLLRDVLFFKKINLLFKCLKQETQIRDYLFKSSFCSVFVM